MNSQWIYVKDNLPKPNEEAIWYDAMFDRCMIFSLPDPSLHDGDFTHWMPLPSPPSLKKPLPISKEEFVIIAESIMVIVLMIAFVLSTLFPSSPV